MKNPNSFKPSKYLAKQKWGLLFYIVLNTIGSACSVFFTIITAKAIEFITGATSAGYSKAIYAFLIAMGITALEKLIYFATNMLYARIQNKFMMEMNQDLAEQAFKLNSETYSHHSTGVFTQRINNEPRAYMSCFLSIITSITSMLSVIAVLIYIICLSPWLGLAIFAILVISSIIELIKRKSFKKHIRLTEQASERVSSLTTEIVKSEKDIKSTGLENAMANMSRKRYAEYHSAVYKKQANSTIFWSIRQAFTELAYLAVIILGIHLLDLGMLTFAVFMIFYSKGSALSTFTYYVSSTNENITSMGIAKERMAALFDEDEFVTERFGTVHKDFVKGSIEFKKVGYSYKEYERTKKTKTTPSEWKIVSENKIFENLSFKIKPNTTVAFVGKSGSGKSTIVNLMSKMYEVDSGEILIDKTNINDFDKDTLRKTISLVNQFPYIFDMTIKKNLLLAKPDATDEELANIIKMAALDEFIDSLPKGLDTLVGEGGIKLSGGQKQRLAIARALLRNSSIIIFDESTSSLDNFAQNDVKKSIDALKGKSTIVIIAHRLSTIKDADTIFFLDKGKIVDTGTFDELFNNNEQFKSMFLVENI